MMLECNRLIVVVTVCAVAGVAYPKAGVIKVLTAAGAGLEANPDVDGGVVMNYHDSSGQYGAVTEIQLQAKWLEPNTVYGVQVEPGVTDRFAFTTNANGHGHWHNFVTFDVTQFNPTIRIFLDDGSTNPFDWSHISYAELRAIGCPEEPCTVGEPCFTAADCDDNFLCTDETCDGGYCFHAPHDCGDGYVCQMTHYNCQTGCLELCTTEGEEGCCNFFGPCPPPAPPPCPCPGGWCGCPEAPCP